MCVWCVCVCDFLLYTFTSDWQSCVYMACVGRLYVKQRVDGTKMSCNMMSL